MLDSFLRPALAAALALLIVACASPQPEPASADEALVVQEPEPPEKVAEAPADAPFVPSPPGRPRLVAPSSTDPGAAATFFVLSPGEEEGGEWSVEQVRGTEAPVDLWLGELPDGRTVWRSVDAEVAPLDTALKLVPGRERWTIEPWPEIALADVTWKTRRDRETGDPVPRTKSYQLVDGNVFHKAVWFEPMMGEPGVLTISANVPMLALWRESDAGWTREVLWTAAVGDSEQRFRDFEVGDVDGDGQDEIVLATHNTGGVYVLEQTRAGLVGELVGSFRPMDFVHEVEIGQVDDDPALEFFATPAEPNLFDGSQQRGRIVRFDHTPDGYRTSVVVDGTDSHYKEILIADLDGDGRDELYGAREAENLRADFTSDEEGHLDRFAFDDAGGVTRSQVGGLRGALCRFLVAGDVDGDGRPEIVASTSRDGIFVFAFGTDGDWTRRKLAGGFRSSGYEHAVTLADVDGNGVLDVVAASDNESRFQAFCYDPARQRWVPRLLATMTWTPNLTWGLKEIPPAR